LVEKYADVVKASSFRKRYWMSDEFDLTFGILVSLQGYLSEMQPRNRPLLLVNGDLPDLPGVGRGVDGNS
jgi:hypothetical protein